MPTLNFKGKAVIETYHHTVPHHRLEFSRELSLLAKGQEPSLDGNLIIEGDNLLALKALLPTHAGKIKCVYIDPPYNTGNEGWVYNDNFTQPQFKEWIGKTVGKEGEDATRHDKWCCMMWPRLTLLRELMDEDGVIAIHIDENEHARLTELMDEIFGADESLGEIVWDKGNPKGDAQGVAYQHESIVIWAKCARAFLRRELLQREKPNARDILAEAARLVSKIGKPELPDDLKTIAESYDLPATLTEQFRRPYTVTDAEQELARWLASRPEISGGERMYRRITRTQSGRYRVYRLVSMAWPNKKRAPDEYFQPLQHPVTKKLCPIPARGWRYPPSTMKRLLASGLIEFGPDESTQPQQIYYLDENLTENVPSVLRYAGSDDDLFAALKLQFEHAKPHEFSARLISYLSKGDDVVLDSCAGSGTTAHAISLLNKSGASNRRYLLVQQPHDTKKDEDAHHNICRDVLRPRLIATIPEAALKSRYFTYAVVGDPLFGEYRDLGDKLPSFEELAKYVFYTETSRQCDLKTLDEASGFIGSTPAAGGTSYYLLYTPNNKIDRELSVVTLKTLLERDQNRTWVIYCEKIWIHEETRREFERETGKRVRPMLVPFNLK